MNQTTVIFDGGCGFCRASVRLVDRFDWFGRFAQMPFDRAMDEYPASSSWMLESGLRVAFPDGSATIGVDAVRSIMVRTPLGVPFGLMLYLPGVHALARRVYRWVASRRHGLGARCAPSGK
jgi:predicted DCC family thiol-disulfide oxidoreductase YuxK